MKNKYLIWLSVAVLVGVVIYFFYKKKSTPAAEQNTAVTKPAAAVTVQSSTAIAPAVLALPSEQVRRTR